MDIYIYIYEFHGFTRILKIFTWIYMDFEGFTLISVSLSGFMRIYMDLYSFMKDLCGFTWTFTLIQMYLHGFIWFDGFTWIYMTLIDSGKHATSVIGGVCSTMGASRLDRGGGLEEGGPGSGGELWMTESMLGALAPRD